MNDKKIEFEWLPPFNILAQYRELDTEKEKNSARAEYKKGTEKNGTSRWVQLLMEARTFFEGSEF